MSSPAAPDLPFPPYRHRPGRTPHPERDPRGHRFFERLPPGLLPAEPIPLEAIPDDRLFSYGEELFRAAYWWEAHAVWEELWRAAPRAEDREPPEREVLRAFIQLAAAALRKELGGSRGSRKLLKAALSGMERAGRRPESAALRRRFESLRADAGLAAGGETRVNAEAGEAPG